jgi:carboxymethylenebutenolidase
MCFEPTARPPLSPIAGGAGVAEGDHIVLRATDGTDFSAFSARTVKQEAPGIVILPDARGLHPFYRELAGRFAEAGVHATAIDYFGRTAGTEERGEDFDFMSHVLRTTPDQIALDVEAGLEHLSSEAGGAATRFFTVGFCFGGRKSFNEAAKHARLAGVIGFYGAPQRRGADDVDPPVELANSYRCKILGLFGGADPSIPPDAVEAFRAALDEARVPNDLVAYEGAPHSFFDRSFDEYRAACDDAWRRMLGFVGV